MHYANKKATMGIHETSEIKMAVNGNKKFLCNILHLFIRRSYKEDTEKSCADEKMI